MFEAQNYKFFLPMQHFIQDYELFLDPELSRKFRTFNISDVFFHVRQSRHALRRIGDLDAYLFRAVKNGALSNSNKLKYYD
jgi:hypothetical protein